MQRDALISRARAILNRARSVVALTGAGVSAESGIPTFRGSGGLWAGVRIDDVATPEGFARDPVKVWRWYNQRRDELKQARPNPGHLALAELQRQVRRRGGSMVLVTQNIDGLHQAAGSEGVLELHGSLRAMRCGDCGRAVEIGLEPVEPVPRCDGCGGMMRPAVVWFGESLPEDVFAAALQAASRADAFLSVGTSALVYPAAGLVDWAISAGAATIEVNLEPTPNSRRMDVAIHGLSGEILPRLVGERPST